MRFKYKQIIQNKTFLIDLGKNNVSKPKVDKILIN